MFINLQAAVVFFDTLSNLDLRSSAVYKPVALTLTQYPYDPGTLPSSTIQCILGMCI